MKRLIVLLLLGVVLGLARTAAGQGLTTTFFRGAGCAPLPNDIAGARLQRSLQIEDGPAWAIPAGVTVPYTVRMSGMFRANATGTYVFRFDADDGIVFAIDGIVALNVTAPRSLDVVEVPIDLTAGDHVVEICHLEDGGPVRFVVDVRVPGASSFSAITPAQLVYDPGFGGGATAVAFDAIAAGTYLTDQLEASSGITFATQLGSGGFYYSRPRVVAVGAGTTASPPNILQNESYDAIEATNISSNVPLLIRFAVPQSHVSIETGTLVTLPQRPNAILRALDSTGRLVAAHRIDAVSPSVIHRLHVLRGATDIALISVDHGGAANDERVDGLRFEAFEVVAPPTDTEPPVVEFLEPTSSTVRGAGTLRIIVRVRENSGVVGRVRATAGSATAELEVDGTPDPACIPPICARYIGGLMLGNGLTMLRVEAEDGAGNVGAATITFDFTGVTELTIRDEEETHVEGAELFVDGRLRSFATDPDGVIRLFPPLPPGARIAARRRLGESPTYRDNHAIGSTQNWNFRTYLTSVTIEDDGNAAVQTVTAGAPVNLVIRRSNVLVGVHLTAAADWDATPSELAAIVAEVQDASDFLYNATDGQFVIEQLDLVDQRSEWADVDIRVHARRIRANVPSHTGGFLGANVVRTNMNVSRFNNGLTYAHEFGHYGLDLKDEYEDGDESKACTFTAPKISGSPFDSGQPQTSCMMWSQWEAPKLCSDHADNPHVRGLRQGDTPCWDKILQRYGNPMHTLKTPTTRGVIPASVTSPVAAWRELRANVTNRTTRPRCALFTQQFLKEDGTPFEGALVTLRVADGPGVGLGTTNNEGRVEVIGAHVGDVIRLEAAVEPDRASGPIWEREPPAWRPGERVRLEASVVVDEARCLAP